MERLSDPGSGGVWTRRQVQYHRARLGLPRFKRQLQCGEDWRLVVQRRYQHERGWAHLLPTQQADDTWGPGLTLRKREVDILCALRDRGSLTLAELSEAVGVRSLLSDGRSCLARMVRQGLVIASTGCPPLYALLAPEAPANGYRRPTGVEQRLAALEKIRA